MKIYFAGSIRGGRQDAELYSILVDHLKKYGEVLTEHVSDLDLTKEGEDGENDKFIYERDMNWLREADFVVAEVTTPSTGVGYELGEAKTAWKDVLCLYRKNSKNKLSAMVSGNENFHVREYKTIEEALDQIDEFITENFPYLLE